MAYQHGIYVQERATNIAMTTATGSGVPVIIGTAPIHLATQPAPITRPVLCYNLQEFTKNFGYSDDFDKYTLCEAAYVFFQQYSISPCVFINVLDPGKHYNKLQEDFGGVTENPITIPGAIDIDSLEVTSGVRELPTELEKDVDYTLTRQQEDEVVTITLTLINQEKIENDKVKIYYKTDEDGEDVELEYNVREAIEQGGSMTLSRDMLVDTARIITGGKNTLVELTAEDYAAEYIDGEVVVTVINSAKVLDDTITITYNVVDASQVKASDLIGTVDDKGRSTGIELVDSVAPLFTTNTGGNIVSILAGVLLAPKFSCDESVATALKVKAQGVSGMFPALAVVDLDTSKAVNYQDAADLKIRNALNDSHMLVCWPKVKLADRVFHMSTHAAALMQQTDSREGNEIPYISPSNHSMSVGCTCLEDGTEVFLTRDQANYLNGNGICTAINIAGWRFWGNRTAAYPGDTSPQNSFIPVRRMFNYVTNFIMTNYLTTLDSPLTRRMIDSVLNKANIWLAGLTNQGALLGARLEFNQDDNDLASLADGKVVFALMLTPPSPAKEIHFSLRYDINYLNTLFE